MGNWKLKAVPLSWLEGLRMNDFVGAKSVFQAK